MTQNTEESEFQHPVFWWQNELGETRPFKFSRISATPPPEPLREADRAKFLKELDLGLFRYSFAKSGQESMYGKEIAEEYLPGHEPREVIEARKKADEEFLAMMEETDSEDQRLLARIRAGPGGAAMQGPEVRRPQSSPRKRQQDMFADAIDEMRRVKRRKALPAASTTAAAAPIPPAEPSQPLALAEPVRGGSSSNLTTATTTRVNNGTNNRNDRDEILSTASRAG